jgi:hypothetical protein
MFPQLRILPRLTKEFQGPFPINILPILTYWDFGIPTVLKWITIEADKIFGERLWLERKSSSGIWIPC